MKNGVVVVGGSLSGLTFALACARRGIPSTVLERVVGHKNGAALGIDRSLLMRVISIDADYKDLVAGFPPTTVYRQALTWRALHDWLRIQTQQWTEITLVEGLEVASVAQNAHSATVSTANGESIPAQVIVGADGYRSVVRRVINPLQPEATYAGYILWRGLVPEAELLPGTRWPPDNNGIALATGSGYRLIAYPVAGPGGSLQPGQRLISFAWYDSTRDALLRDLGCLSATDRVLSALTRENIPARVYVELRDQACQIWPVPWRSAIVHALEQHDVFATPVAEYFPERLQRGRLAIVGDAAHVVSPVTGRGFIAGILDAETLADCLRSALDLPEDSVTSALKRYEDKRLSEAQELATASIEWSRAFCATRNASEPSDGGQ